MEQQNQSYLATEKIGSLMRKYAVPCVISLLAGAVLNMILDPDFLTFLVSIVVIILAYRELKQTEK